MTSGAARQIGINTLNGERAFLKGRVPAAAGKVQDVKTTLK